MFDYSLSTIDDVNVGEHIYSFASTGSKRIRTKTFDTRKAAMSEMYKWCRKLNLYIKKVYDDKHDKTYVCSNGIKFYIQRM